MSDMARCSSSLRVQWWKVPPVRMNQRCLHGRVAPPSQTAAAMRPHLLQKLFRSLNCTTGFDAATLKQQLKNAWGSDVWLTCNAA